MATSSADEEIAGLTTTIERRRAEMAALREKRAARRSAIEQSTSKSTTYTASHAISTATAPTTTNNADTTFGGSRFIQDEGTPIGPIHTPTEIRLAPDLLIYLAPELHYLQLRAPLCTCKECIASTNTDITVI